MRCEKVIIPNKFLSGLESHTPLASEVVVSSKFLKRDDEPHGGSQYLSRNSKESSIVRESVEIMEVAGIFCRGLSILLLGVYAEVQVL